jgi:hypothetical protein
MTLTDYANPWLADRQLKPRTRQLYRSLLDHHILPTLGGKPLTTLTAADIRGWHAQQDRATPTATAHANALLRTILGSAVDDDLIPTNPAQIRGASQTKRLHRIEPATPGPTPGDHRQSAAAVRSDGRSSLIKRQTLALRPRPQLESGGSVLAADRRPRSADGL